VSGPIPTISVREYQPNAEALDGLALNGDEIQVWKQYLTRGPAEIESLQRLLSPDELGRAQRFRFSSDRNHFIVARGMLRTLLGHYLTVSPVELSFSYSSFGRPSITHPEVASAFDFNISHSGGVALMAFSMGRQIGIDVEQVRGNFGTVEIAERFFSVAERAALQQLPEEERQAAFFRCWTRKEAFIKALGEGLSHPLDQFDVSLGPDTPAALLATRPDATEVQRWELYDIRLPGDYVAALALEVLSVEP
jgi:4'-phosphopantetheinyl transferase